MQKTLGILARSFTNMAVNTEVLALFICLIVLTHLAPAAAFEVEFYNSLSTPATYNLRWMDNPHGHAPCSMLPAPCSAPHAPRRAAGASLPRDHLYLPRRQNQSFCVPGNRINPRSVIVLHQVPPPHRFHPAPGDRHRTLSHGGRSMERGAWSEEVSDGLERCCGDGR